MINVRVEEDLYNFIDKVSKKIGIDKSELIRRIVEFHFLELFLDKLPKQNLGEMRMEFRKVVERDGVDRLSV